MLSSLNSVTVRLTVANGDDLPSVPPGRTAARRSTPRRSESRLVAIASGSGARVAVGLDALLADLFGDRLLIGLLLGAETHALLEDDLLVDDRALLVQHGLVLLVGDLRAVERLLDVARVDRLALDADLLA